MKKSTQKKIERRLENRPKYFVDSSVFVEILLKQDNSDECLSFFNRGSYKYRLLTNTLVLGEVLKVITKIEDSAAKREEANTFIELLGKGGIQVTSLTFTAIANLNAVREIDSFLQASDALIFSSALTEACNGLITLDKDYSSHLGRGLGMKIKNPTEA
ncbi:MAG: PIN domain-containing protein [Nanoarchaeota archaeon]|nr:PIN domain-containing protein [Nanoarchaeota archaeon]